VAGPGLGWLVLRENIIYCCFRRGIEVAQERKRIKGPWSAKETNTLEKLYHEKSVLDIAFELNRAVGAVRNKATELGLRKRQEREWTKKELNELKKKYSNTATWIIANKFNRSSSEVRRKARDLGLSKPHGIPFGRLAK